MARRMRPDGVSLSFTRRERVDRYQREYAKTIKEHKNCVFSSERERQGWPGIEYFIQGAHDNYCVSNHKRSKAKRTNYRTEVSPLEISDCRRHFSFHIRKRPDAIGAFRKRIRSRMTGFASVHPPIIPNQFRELPSSISRIRPWLKKISGSGLGTYGLLKYFDGYSIVFWINSDICRQPGGSKTNATIFNSFQQRAQSHWVYIFNDYGDQR